MQLVIKVIRRFINNRIELISNGKSAIECQKDRLITTYAVVWTLIHVLTNQRKKETKGSSSHCISAMQW